MMELDTTKLEFELVVKRYGKRFESSNFGYPVRREKEEEPKEELIEKLEFKSLSSTEVIRKMLDYLQTK